MYQHQRMPLPLEQLKAVPQPVVVLLEVLLEKDPAEHYRSAELVFAWSFYRQGSSGETPVADEFLEAALIGLAIQIHFSERRGRRAKDWRSSWRIVKPYWFWMAWSHSKIRLGHKRDGCVSLLSTRSCASLLPSIRGFA
jgi:hypothetical protein